VTVLQTPRNDENLTAIDVTDVIASAFAALGVVVNILGYFAWSFVNMIVTYVHKQHPAYHMCSYSGMFKVVTAISLGGVLIALILGEILSDEHGSKVSQRIRAIVALASMLGLLYVYLMP
jgi:hypothetical protein